VVEQENDNNKLKTGGQRIETAVHQLC